MGSPAFKAGGTGDPRPAGSIPVHLRHSSTLDCVTSPEATTEPSVDDPSVGDRSERGDAATMRQAWAVVVAITLIAALIIIDFAFSTANPSSSIDGNTATSSQYISGS